MGVKREAGVVREVVAGPFGPARKGAVKYRESVWRPRRMCQTSGSVFAFSTSAVRRVRKRKGCVKGEKCGRRRGRIVLVRMSSERMLATARSWLKIIGRAIMSIASTAIGESEQICKKSSDDVLIVITAEELKKYVGLKNAFKIT